ncbi:type III pantothenate kinase [Thermovibrio ammonificans]
MQSTERKLVVLDVGNTAVKAALFEGGKLFSLFTVPTARASEELPLRLKNLSGTPLAYASVVPEVSRLIDKLFPQSFSVSRAQKLPINVNYGSKMGADRLAAMSALHHFESYVVVSCGTATVIDAVKEKEFVGGYILPGLYTMAEALREKTALLPEVKEFKTLKPGRSTRECISAGILAATVGAVKAVVEHIGIEPNRIFLTGGAAKDVGRVTGWRLVEGLVLRGIVTLYLLNKGGKIPPTVYLP